MMSLAEAQRLVPGAVLVGDPALRVKRVHSDTRTLQVGDLFVALRGERFDAHDFLPQARAAGAVAAIAERGLAETGLPGLQVPDTLAALQALAGGWRARFTLWDRTAAQPWATGWADRPTRPRHTPEASPQCPGAASQWPGQVV